MPGRVLGVVAGLLWVAGVALLLLGLLDVRTPVDVVTSRDPGFASVFFRPDPAPVRLLTAGTVLVGVAGVLTGGLVLRHGRRP